MGQEIRWVKALSAYRAKPSVQRRHGLLLGYSFSISISQDIVYMYIDIYLPTLNCCCMPWCVLQPLVI